jgi:hypothetical protein
MPITYKTSQILAHSNGGRVCAVVGIVDDNRHGVVWNMKKAMSIHFRVNHFIVAWTDGKMESVDAP